MKTFKQFFTESKELLQEKLITFGRKAYPKHGNVVLLAGGAGSGKGFVTGGLLGIEGKIFDVDEIKKMIMGSNKLKARIKKETGIDVSKLNLKNPSDVSTLHNLAERYGVEQSRKASFFADVVTKAEKPNVIFDVTLKSMSKLHNLSKSVMDLGYEKKNIHIVWVINDYKVAMKQNLARSRTVPEDILIDTHKGASQTMFEIMKSGGGVKKYMDGDIWFVFNQIGVDSDTDPVVSSLHPKIKGVFVKDANYIKVKEQGKSPMKMDEFDSVMMDKIKSYVPDIDSWQDVK